MSVLAGVEFYSPVVVETGRNFPVRSDGFYDGKVAIGDAEVSVGSCELNTIT
jgi:hypothetical protein